MDSEEAFDLSNGVKYGQSTVYDSGQYNKEILRFRRMANGSGGDSDFDMNTGDFSSSFGFSEQLVRVYDDSESQTSNINRNTH